MAVQNHKSYAFVALTGPKRGESYPIKGSEFLIGGCDEADLRLQDSSVNWRHAIVRKSDKTLTVQPLTSFGVEVNHVRITAETPLHPGDIVSLTPDHVLRLDGSAAQKFSPILKYGLAGLAVIFIILALVLSSDDGDEASRPLSDGEALKVATRLVDMSERSALADQLPQGLTVLLRRAVECQRLGFRAQELTAWRNLSVFVDRLGSANSAQLPSKSPEPASSRKLRAILNADGMPALRDDQYMAAVTGLMKLRLRSLQSES